MLTPERAARVLEKVAGLPRYLRDAQKLMDYKPTEAEIGIPTVPSPYDSPGKPEKSVVEAWEANRRARQARVRELTDAFRERAGLMHMPDDLQGHRLPAGRHQLPNWLADRVNSDRVGVAGRVYVHGLGKELAREIAADRRNPSPDPSVRERLDRDRDFAKRRRGYHAAQYGWNPAGENFDLKKTHPDSYAEMRKLSPGMSAVDDAAAEIAKRSTSRPQPPSPSPSAATVRRFGPKARLLMGVGALGLGTGVVALARRAARRQSILSRARRALGL